MSDLKEAPTAEASLEVRRIKAAARAKLFGEAAAPPQISRYTVLRQLGVGGMGEVFLAHDAELGRKVAIKLVRLDRESGVERASSRLLREAQALARLSHPNVVQVYEVGHFEGRVFIAMEFVHGVHMRRWLEAEPRPWRQILDLYIQAGQGLAAAHRVGMVHRDFKPENVLVGDDGRVRVVDFGLVRKSLDPDAPPGDLSEGASAEDLERSSRLTQSGALMGTPSYMSPEQLQGLKATAKSDQFAFCVALYRGLYGWHPFAAETRLELKRRVLSGQIAAPPRDAKVPAGIFAVLGRGMSVDPDRRYPSMEALLAALAAPPRRRRVGRIASVAAAVLAGAAVTWVIWPAASEPPPAAAAAPGWGDAERGAIERAFSATALAYAGPASARALAGMDRYAAELQTVRAALVQAAHPPAIAVRQADCLRRRERRLAVLAAAFAHADAVLVERSAELVESLPPIDPCHQLDALPAGPAPADDPAGRDDARAAEQAVDDARALALRRRWDEAARRAEDAAELAARASAEPLRAEARAVLGRATLERGAAAQGAETLAAALDLADAVQHLELAGELALELAEVPPQTDIELALALTYARRAAAAAEGLRDRSLAARAALARAALLRRQGRHDEAETQLRAVGNRLDGLPTLAARVELELARILIAARRPDEAGLPLARVVEALRELPNHPLRTDAEAELSARKRAAGRRGP